MNRRHVIVYVVDIGHARAMWVVKFLDGTDKDIPRPIQYSEHKFDVWASMWITNRVPPSEQDYKDYDV